MSNHSTPPQLSAEPAHNVVPPMVGVGASAGGLAAIIELLTQVPAASGLAFVVVQHLDADHPGLLAEVLAAALPLPVSELRDGMPVAPDQVYVLPADCVVDLERGHFSVRPASGPHLQHLPIDQLFAALARYCGARAVALVLSGMGQDGSRGLAAVREAGGLTLAQLPSSAQFDAMPSSAISAGVVDIVALPAQMADFIVAWWRSGGVPLQAEREGLRQLFQLLRQHTGANFSDYKLSTVLRRVDRRMKLRQCATLAEYVACLRATPAELELLFKELLIGVTQFFRDPRVWDELTVHVLPALLAAHPQGAEFKAWVPACSTGEEAYTLAIAFREACAATPQPAAYTLQIFATDLDADAIARARQGVFDAGIRDQVPAALLQRYFVPLEQGAYRIAKELRGSIIFAQHNVISDPPFTRLDILSCRNLLIYFTAKLQQQLIPLFHYALKADGLLVLGSADTPGAFHELFVPLAPKGRIYRRVGALPRHVSNYFLATTERNVAPSSIEESRPTMSLSLQQQIEQHLLQSHTPAAALLSADGDILYIHGRTGAFLEPAAGKANWNIHAMARDGVRHIAADLLLRASAESSMVAARDVPLSGADGKRRQLLDLTAQALSGGALQGMVLMTFALRPAPLTRQRRAAGDPQVPELARQLAQARRELQTVREEMQSSREELRAANEELQSTNEELQSTNEELVTSKEEMQSLNEELSTVNAELQSKVDDLSTVNGDMKNLLNSTDIATIFLDGEMRIRRYTDRATQLYKLIPSDVQRPLGDINNELDYPDLERDAREVLSTLVFCERQIPTRGGRWFSVRIMPYRTVDNVIDGVVLTFVNITEAKQLEARLRSMQDQEGGNAGPA